MRFLVFLNLCVMTASGQESASVLIALEDLPCFAGSGAKRCREFGANRGPAEASAIHVDGPLVKLLKPLEKQVECPTTLEIAFLPNGAPVDLTSLQIKASRWLALSHSYGFSMDVTKKFKPYVAEGGISWPNVKIASGKYRFRLTLRDKAGRISGAVFDVEVK